MLILNDKDRKIINLNNVTYIETQFRKLTIHFRDGITTTCTYESDELKEDDVVRIKYE